MIGGNVLSFLGRHSKELLSVFVTAAVAKAGAIAAEEAAKAAPAWLDVLAHYGEASLRTFATDLIEVHNLVDVWVHLLGF